MLEGAAGRSFQPLHAASQKTSKRKAPTRRVTEAEAAAGGWGWGSSMGGAGLSRAVETLGLRALQAPKA